MKNLELNLFTPTEVVEVSSEATKLGLIFEDFNLIRNQTIDGEIYFVLNDFAEHVVKTNQPSRYIGETLTTMKKKGFDISGSTESLKFKSNDGKMYALKCVNGATLLRICQEVNSPRFEVMRQWMAGLGYRELKEIKNPSLTIERGIKAYKKQGKSDIWISQRFSGIPYRTDYTSAVFSSTCPKPNIGILTNIAQESLLGCSTSNYKILHGIRKTDTVRNHIDEHALTALRLVESAGAERIRTIDHPTQEKHEETARFMAEKAKQIYDLTRSIVTF